MTSRIGIMQGRLSPRPADRLQAFPHASWRREFDVAARVGFDAIEWIFEAERVEDNPLASAAGRAEIRRAVAESGVAVRSVCGDYFMKHRLAGDGTDATRKNRSALLAVIEATRDIGAERILLPLLETSAVNTPELVSEVQASLTFAADDAARSQVVLGLELEIEGHAYRAVIDGVGHPSVRAYYDTGNSTAQGFDVGTDIVPLLDVLHAVHVKDRKRGGGSVPLGTGDTNFRTFFGALARHGFQGDVLLQHYFDEDPEGAALAALELVRALLAGAGKSS